MPSEARAMNPWWASPQAHLLTALIAFSSGALVMWLVDHRGAVSSQPVIVQSQPEPNRLLPAAAPAAPGASATQGIAEAAQAGHDFYDQRRWTEAISRYEYVIANGGDHPDIRTNLGNCYRFIGQPQKALEEYAVAQKQNPRHEFSLFNTATLYVEVLNDLSRATEVWRLYEARFPEGAASERTHRFLSQNPRFAAALKVASPIKSASGAIPETAPAQSENEELRNWMQQEASLPTP